MLRGPCFPEEECELTEADAARPGLGKYLGRQCDRDTGLLLQLLLRPLQLVPQVFVLLDQPLPGFHLLSQQLADRLEVVPHLPRQVKTG